MSDSTWTAQGVEKVVGREAVIESLHKKRLTVFVACFGWLKISKQTARGHFMDTDEQLVGELHKYTCGEHISYSLCVWTKQEYDAIQSGHVKAYINQGTHIVVSRHEYYGEK